ncbi:TetR family transcriptional regulator [Aquabacterium sp.]|uniref:TetR family transcriptional regulator n=1 Tax=Aquabacterium sp. TaxID=1872578 RepID=UPI002488D548|nr:TetR family transcriptional regulator [Aquabacterium sp.]MDI1261103.1 TetR family transcriptional regulator [Aquabacterium sp.]
MSTQKQAVKRLRDVHAEATRTALVAAARLRFSEAGFAATSLDDVASDAGTTKGAVYHHFKDKKALFKEVYEALSKALIADVSASRGGRGTPAEVALHAFLVHAGQSAYQRVLFRDGPVVLGTAECRAMDMQYSLGLLTRLIEAEVSPELLSRVGSEAMAKMLLALFVESAQVIAMAPKPKAMLGGIKVMLNRMILALAEPAEDDAGV